MSYTAKSVILDIIDTYTEEGRWTIRQMDFWYEGSKITNLHTTDFLAYALSESSYKYLADNSFDTSTSKIGTQEYNQWLSAWSYVPHRLICVFNSPITFDEIRVNNSHSNGGSTGRGAKNVKLHISTDAITDTTYDAAIANSTLIYNSTFDQHVAADVEDEQILTLISAESTALQDMKTDILLWQDTVKDMELDLYAAAWACSDQKLDISAHYQAIEDAQLDIFLGGYILSDFKLDTQVGVSVAINAILDLAVFYEDLENMKLDTAILGDKVQDFPTDLVVAGWINEDGKLDIAAYFESLGDFFLDTHIAAWTRKDKKLDISTAVRVLEDAKLIIHLAQELSNQNIILDMWITDGDSLQDASLDIWVTDGIKLHNVGLDIAVVGVMPAFKAVYAMHLDSVIKEII